MKEKEIKPYPNVKNLAVFLILMKASFHILNTLTKMRVV